MAYIWAREGLIHYGFIKQKIYNIVYYNGQPRYIGIKDV